MVEIERKFLVKTNAYKALAFRNERIVQGFLNRNPNRTVRVRIKGKQGYLTIKGKSNEAGTSRFEWEREIDVVEAESLLSLCEDGIVEKTRYEVQIASHVFEVDQFDKENAGLVIAEVELQSEDENFEKPDWLGEEVTGQIKYYNSQLSKQPFKNW